MEPILARLLLPAFLLLPTILILILVSKPHLQLLYYRLSLQSHPLSFLYIPTMLLTDLHILDLSFHSIMKRSHRDIVGRLK
jgi:hypothetical protein